MILGIYGAGGLGREILVLAQQINEKISKWEDIVFIDDKVEDMILSNIKVYKFILI